MLSSWSLLREAVHILLEGAPAGIDTGEVESALAEVEGVMVLHDLHVWTITSGFVALSAHVVVQPDADSAVLWRLRGMVRERFGIVHTTIQLESTRDPQPSVVRSAEPPS